MKLETVKSRIGKILSKVEKVVGKNMNLPVLSCVLLEAKKNGLIIKATNLDLGVEVNIPAKVSKEGIVAVPAGTLSSLLNNIKDDDKVVLELNDTKLHITTDTSSTHINTVPHDDFPGLPKIEEDKGNTLICDVDDFVSGLKAVWSSAAVSSIKPELSSVYVYSEEGQLYFVATDSFRLAEKKIPFKKADIDDGILIPVKNVVEIVRFLEDARSEVKILFDDGQITFRFDDVYITSRIVDGTFPNYRQIIPNSFDTESTLLKDDVFDALKMVNIFSDTFNKITFSIKPSEKQFVISTKNNDVGDTQKKLDAQMRGSAVTINFNYNYIIDGFSVLNSQSVVLKCNDGSKPMIITGKGDDSFTYLVMPMNK